MKRLTAILVFLVFCLSGCSAAAKGLEENKVPSVESYDELCDALQDSLEKGEDSYTFTTDSLDEDKLMEVNNDLDSFYGYVDSCETKTSVIGKSEITYYLVISDNTYVERSILYGEDIPADQEKAIALREKCKKIIENQLEGRETSYQKERAIHDYLVKNTAYGYPDNDQNKDSDAYFAYGALIRKEAVCNGYAQAMKLLCDIAGIPCEMMTGISHGDHHAWNLVKLEDGKWYQVDATWDDPKPDVAGRVLYNYFNITDEQSALDHQWEEENYPAAEGTEYNYFTINGLSCDNYEEFKSKCQEILREDSPEVIQLQVKDYDESIYNNESMQFIFENGNIKSLTFQVLGEKPYTSLYLSLTYQ